MKKKKCRVLKDYHNDCGVKRKAGSTINLRLTAAKMREIGGFVEILNPDKKPVVPELVEKKEVIVKKIEAEKKPRIAMKKCKVLITFFDGKKRTVGEKVELTDAEANRHALAGRVKIIKPRVPAISSAKKSAGALAKPKKKRPVKPIKPTKKKKPVKKRQNKRGKKNAK